ncbi:aspartyl-phosphate phosphatase Spo0E family protein [Mesobacillus zeae]|uniref:Aspartyl-phosphate phosphatase Spo0E family protein n=2 Tax=Mesobacillus zeae TaxID=1917180 RepID=A0A398BHM4_9BACI|nr:aspartyl-phosphate phosphatase Spo0E family protein [Mesobacillus zeae]RID88128.1 aspartyl-phosphate phosphatase Spo0E family protein [Mesobacillus zeae]
MEKIQLKRDEMIACARATGLNSEETICCSQELDRLIFLCQDSHKRRQQRKQSGLIFVRQMILLMNKFKNPARII